MTKDNENIALWQSWESVPNNAIKPITAGRLKGMSDINPMWRYKVLTETFGACGTGWCIRNEEYTILDVSDGEKIVICRLMLHYVTPEGVWSEGVPGQGGSKLTTMEKSGLYNSDEAFKMAYTDAVSVACKQLGIGANVYWSGNTGSKYPTNAQTAKPAQTDDDPLGTGSPAPACADCGAQISQRVHDFSAQKFGRPLCINCQKKQ